MSSSEKKLFLLDAYALIFRSYYAFIKNPRINSKGLNTSAIFGFVNTLLDVLKNQKPSHIAVVFDPPGGTHRNIDYADYKANRDETPEDIKIAVPYIKRILNGFRIPVLQVEGYEADDTIGTLAHIASEKDFMTYMMTPDKDFGQLVKENVFIYKPARLGNDAEIMGIAEVCAKFEISNPLQVIDILGLMGDAVDNIPGVPGVGEKTAKKLIQDFGSVEGVYENLDKQKGKLKENLENNHDKAIMSKRLATIHLNVPIEFVESDLILEEPDKELLRELFTELEFRQLIQRVLGETPAAATAGQQIDLFSQPTDAVISTSAAEVKEEKEEGIPYKTALDVVHNYTIVSEEAEIVKLAAELNQLESFCFDTETTGLDPLKAMLVGFSFSWKKGEGYYVPVTQDFEAAKHVAQLLKPALENNSITKIGQNIKYDMLVLVKYGVKVQGQLFDTMLAHYLIEPDNNRRSMDSLSQNYLHYDPIHIESLIGAKGKNQGNMADVEVEKAAEYAVEDADVTLQLKSVFEPMLKETGTQKLFETVETPLIHVLAEMELEGIRMNPDSLYELSKELDVDIAKMEEEIYAIAGQKFNIGSPKQVGEILFEKLEVVKKAKKTKTGQYATNEETLQQLANEHPIINKILDFRELKKLQNTYVDVLPTMINPETGRIHTTFNQVVAATGRLSSDNPNLQNIPIRTERGREIRKAFVPRNDDYTLLSADYSQIELRIIAALSEDEGMMDAFKNKIDIHTATAAKVYNIGIEEVSKEMRSKAKMVNFGIIYGISAFGLSQRLNIPRGEAKEMIDQYFLKYPGVKRYMDESVVKARDNGYVETILGRRRYLRDINSANFTVRGFAERNAINAPIQGSAADMIKVAMINISKWLKEENLGTKMLLQVHDELIFDVPKAELDYVKPKIVALMQNAIQMPIPIEVEAGNGDNWLVAH